MNQLTVLLALLFLSACQQQPTRPNILILMSDNQYADHLGIYGDVSVRTPHIDSIAREGVRFQNAFCSAPSCTPSRAAFLTGQEIWRLEEGANLWGSLPAKFKTYVDLLEEAGYTTGFQGKGWGPGDFKPGGRDRNPGGNSFSNIGDFLEHVDNGSPWTYWFSSKHPHRPFRSNAGENSGIVLADIQVPAYLPDTDSVRSDIADYYAAIETFDQEVGTIIQILREKDQLHNTVIVVCSDNGWQMPRGLANLYDAGSRVPLIISYPKWSQEERVYTDFVSLNDLAPTFLELGQIAVPDAVTARSLLPLLKSSQTTGQADSTRDAVFMARERHAYVRTNGKGYPARAIRTKDFLYIQNYEPERWPAGDPPLFGDVDAHMLHYPSPAKVAVMQTRNTKDSLYFSLAFAKRPAEELYDLAIDKDQLHNVAGIDAYREQQKSLKEKLYAYLKQTDDPRVTGGATIWDTVPYYNDRDKAPRPSDFYRRALELDSVYQYNN